MTPSHPRGLVRITGSLDAEVLERCLETLIDSHPELRARIDRRTGRPLPATRAPRGPGLSIVETCARQAADRQRDAQRILDDDRRQSFEPGQRLLRATLVRLGDSEHVLQVTLHAAVGDGARVASLLEALPARYAAAGSPRGAATRMLPHFDSPRPPPRAGQPPVAAFHTSGSSATLSDPVATQA